MSTNNMKLDNSTVKDDELDVAMEDAKDTEGGNMIAIEKELAITEGVTVIAPTMSGPFLMAMAAKAAGIGYDMMMAMPIFDANKIRAKARNFLMSAEL